MTRPALRATARAAWRQAKRSRGRSALVIAMVGFPIAALTMGGTIIRTSIPTVEEQVTAQMGSSDLSINVGIPIAQDAESSVEAVRALLPEGSRLASMLLYSKTQIRNGSFQGVNLWEPNIPFTEDPVKGTWVLLDGRAPSAVGEGAASPLVLRAFGIRVGDRLTFDDLSIVVTGVATRPTQFAEEIVVAPGTLASIASGPAMCCHIDLPDGVDAEQIAASLKRLPNLYDVTTRAQMAELVAYTDDESRVVSFAFGATALVLVGTGLIVAAAFVVGLRRQLRALGLVGAAGGDRSHVRAIVLFGGVVLGFVGSLAGVAVGIAAAYATTPHLGELVDALPGRVEVSWAAAAGGVVLGTVAATLAALAPARLAARISTIDALAGRTPAPRPPGRLAGKGLVAVAVGAVAVAFAMIAGESGMLAVGLVAMLGGSLISIPLFVSWVGRIASHLPTAARIAARDTARHGRRTGAATAAATIALILPVAVAALSLSEEEFQRRKRSIGPDQLLISVGVPDATEVPDASAFIRDLREEFPRWIIAERTQARYVARDPASPEEGSRTAYVEGAPDQYGPETAYVQAYPLFVGDGELLRALHAEDGIAALDAGKVVGIGPGVVEGDTVRLLPISGDPADGVTELPAVATGEYRFFLEDMPRFVISRTAAQRLGLQGGVEVRPRPDSSLTSGQFVARAEGPLEADDLARVKELAAGHAGVYITSSEDFVNDFGPIRAAATGGAGLVALGIVAVSVALVAAEARRDRAILVAVGAGPATRRKVVAASAGMLAAIAAVVAVPAGMAPIGVMQAFREGGYPVVIPWPTIAAVLFVVPLVAAGFAALTSRAPKSSAMLQPIA